MEFIQKKWVNVPDPLNLPAIPEGQSALAVLDADNINRIEQGIKDLYSNVVPIFERDVLKNINKHYWKRQAVEVIAKISPNTTTVKSYIYSSGSNVDRPVYYSTYITVDIDYDAQVGKVTLKSPQRYPATPEGYTFCKGRYISLNADGSEPIYYVDSVSYSSSDTNNTVYADMVTRQVSAVITPVGEVEYLYSENIDAYPTGIVGNYLYEYRGVIEDNILSMSNVEIGSYVGTGLDWGNGNYETTLTFSFVPKIVFIICPISTYPFTYGEVFRVFIHGQTQAGVRGDNDSTNSRERLYVSWENNTMKLSAWDSSDNPSIQCNSSGTEYTYIAFS